jgi:hypothetical protein
MVAWPSCVRAMPPRRVERSTMTASALAAARAGAVSLFASVGTSQLARDPDSDAAKLASSKPNAIANIAQLSKNESNLVGAFVSAEPPHERSVHQASRPCRPMRCHHQDGRVAVALKNSIGFAICQLGRLGMSMHQTYFDKVAWQPSRRLMRPSGYIRSRRTAFVTLQRVHRYRTIF